MSDIVWSDVTNLAPELSTTAAGAQTLILGYVNESVDPAVFGGDTTFKYTAARSLLAAHFATTLRRGPSGAGGLILEKVGDVERQFAPLSFASTNYGSTAYGAMFETLCLGLGIGVDDGS